MPYFYKGTVNLTKLAQAFPNTTKAGSNYRRIQRFLSDRFSVDFNAVAWFVMALFGFLESDYYLTLDRSNWQCTQGHKG